MIKENINEVETKIQNAVKRSNRNRNEITLIAVSKTKPISMINEILKEGILDLGENKVQELCDKYDELKEKFHINWHMIGHLQRNKVKYIVDKVTCIHSVDSYRIAEQIDIEAKKKNCICNILIEVNIANESSKFGVLEDSVYKLINDIAKFSNVRVRGLMTVAPYTENAEDNRMYFRKMHDLYVDIRNKNIDNVTMDMLSMGMTNDYEVAIEEGATHIRVGTGLFGER